MMNVLLDWRCSIHNNRCKEVLEDKIMLSLDLTGNTGVSWSCGDGLLDAYSAGNQ